MTTDNAYSGVFAAALATFSISISHDLLSRIGFLDNLIITTGLVIPLLFFTIGAVFSGKIAGDQKALAKSNANLLLRLDENTRKLNEDFSRISKLNAEKVLATETARLHAELHDGVLTYLSMINAMTEESADDKIKSVNVLARNASTEIRVIVEAETIQRMSLFSALSTFRQRVADPLIFLNVTVDWDLRPLQHYNLSDPSVIMGVVRIFQEALHNAVERAKCRDLRVSAEWLAGDRLQVTILNQGGATLKESDTRGIGIRSMKNRAAAIGAKISLRPYPSGAILELVLPNHVSAS